MRSAHRTRLASGLLVLIAAAGCGGEAVARGEDAKSSALVRAERRAYDGAPPVVPHTAFGMTCTECHNRDGREVPGVGFSPPSPHELTAGLSAIARCRQCHVSRETDGIFRANSFSGLPQDLRHGTKLHPEAPPVMPHPVFMRENCQACHSGQAAREEIRTSHPERVRCRQCHVEQVTTEAPLGLRLTAEPRREPS